MTDTLLILEVTDNSIITGINLYRIQGCVFNLYITDQLILTFLLSNNVFPEEHLSMFWLQ